MDRIIGIDYGRKRVGLAVSDPLMLFASALATVPAHEVLTYLKNYQQGERIIKFVVGYPVNLNNLPSEAASDVDIFLKALKKHFPEIPVITEDERFTSFMALRSMIEGGSKKSSRREKSNIDKISAAIILQTFLDRAAYHKEELP